MPPSTDAVRRNLRQAQPSGLQARPMPMQRPDIESALQGLRGEVAGAPAPASPPAGMPPGALPLRLQALAARDPAAAQARFADFQAGRLPAQVAGAVAKPALPVGPESAAPQGQKPLDRPGVGRLGMIERLPGPGPAPGPGAGGPVSMNGGGLAAPGAGPAANLLDRIPPAVRERIATMVAGGGPAIGGAVSQSQPGQPGQLGPGIAGPAQAAGGGGFGAPGAVAGLENAFTPGGLQVAGAGFPDQPYDQAPDAGMGGMAGSPQFASGGGAQFNSWTSPPAGRFGSFNPQRAGGGGYRQLVQSRMYE